MHQKSSDFFNPIAFSSPYTRYALIIIRFLITLINISSIFHLGYLRVFKTGLLDSLSSYAVDTLCRLRCGSATKPEPGHQSHNA